MTMTTKQETKATEKDRSKLSKPEEARIPDSGQKTDGNKDQPKKGTLKLSNPSDGKLWVYRKPTEKSPGAYDSYDAPLMVRVDENDTFATKRNGKSINLVRILEIPSLGKEEADLGYMLPSSLRSTAVFETLDHFGITDETERNIYLANIDHESGRGNTFAEITNYTKADRWKEINAQTRAVADALGGDFEKEFATWTAEKKANCMYGIEGRDLCKAKNAAAGSVKWKCDELGNTQPNDGWNFRGRGAVQITGRAHFKELNDHLNAEVADENGVKMTNYEKATGVKGKTIDVIANPELVTEDEFVAYYAGAFFWKTNAQARIKRTLNANSGSLANAQTLAEAAQNTDADTAVKIGRMSIAGNSTDIQNSLTSDSMAEGLQIVRNNYNTRASLYSAAYGIYEANKADASAANPETPQTAATTQTAATQQTVATPKAAVAQKTETMTKASPQSGADKAQTESEPFSAKEIRAIVQWYVRQKYTHTYIQQIQATAGATPDGIVGPKTIEAVRRWQKENGLEPDGMFGPACERYISTRQNKPSSDNAKNNASVLSKNTVLDSNPEYQDLKNDYNEETDSAKSQTGNAEKSDAQSEKTAAVQGKFTPPSKEFTAAEIEKIKKWYDKQDYAEEFIVEFQRIVGTDPDGSVGKNTINAVKGWQESQKITADGMFGKDCATRAGLTIKKETDEPTDINPHTVNYKQYDSRWAKKMYSNHDDESQTYESSACGPTACASIIAMKNSDVTPVTLGTIAVDKGYRTKNDGTAHAFVPYIGGQYGYSVSETTVEEGCKQLAAGKYAVAVMSTGYWTKGGHYITPYGYKNGTIYVDDPGHSSRPNGFKQKKAAFARECNGFWVFS